jgi:hypothetical protein
MGIYQLVLPDNLGPKNGNFDGTYIGNDEPVDLGAPYPQTKPYRLSENTNFMLDPAIISEHFCKLGAHGSTSLNFGPSPSSFAGM